MMVLRNLSYRGLRRSFKTIENLSISFLTRLAVRKCAVVAQIVMTGLYNRESETTGSLFFIAILWFTVYSVKDSTIHRTTLNPETHESTSADSEESYGIGRGVLRSQHRLCECRSRGNHEIRDRDERRVRRRSSTLLLALTSG